MGRSRVSARWPSGSYIISSAQSDFAEARSARCALDPAPGHHKSVARAIDSAAGQWTGRRSNHAFAARNGQRIATPALVVRSCFCDLPAYWRWGASAEALTGRRRNLIDSAAAIPSWLL